MPAIFNPVTPDSVPSSVQCRALFIPDEPHWIAAVTGALELLTFPFAWEGSGVLTAQEAANAWVEFFDKFCYKQGECRMIGEIILWPTDSSPNSKWLSCDGGSYVRADYPDLFALIGTIYGYADGTHFNLPNLCGRVPLGFGSGAGLSTYSIGDSGGEETHTLVTSETPSHSHTDTGHSHTEISATPSVGAAITGVPVPSAIPSVAITGTGFAGISATGGDGGHNNLQPFLALNYLIRALP